MKNNLLLILSVTAFSLTACNSAGTATSTTTGIYAYIADFSGNALQKCVVASDGTLSFCQNIAQPGTLNNPTGIAINNGQIYVNNSAFTVPSSVPSSYTQCLLNNSMTTLSGCSINTQPGLQYPIGITISGNYSYIGNYFATESYARPGTYTLCNVESNTGSLINCQTNQIENIPADGTPEVVVINNNFGYITDQTNSGYMFCNVSTESGSLNSCQFESLESGIGGVIPIGPRGMMINNGYAYIVNSGVVNNAIIGASSYTVCSVNPERGTLTNCSTQETSPGKLNSPTGIAVYESNVYITNEDGPGYSYTMCGIGLNGFLTNCSTYSLSGATTQTGPWLTYIAFGQ